MEFLSFSTIWIMWNALQAEPVPGEMSFEAAERAFADGHYERALENYRDVLAENPEAVEAMRGKARSFLQTGHLADAVDWFDRAVEREPEFAGTYLNRGIAHDLAGDYEAALADYERAIALNKSVADGPGWLTRLLHMNEPPPTVIDRAVYLEEQLDLPEDERVLSIRDEDTAQRGYRQRLE